MNIFDKYYKDYDNWYDENKELYQLEIEVIKRVLPVFNKGIEIGVGTGRFAKELNIEFGLEPSEKMASIARERGIKVSIGKAEDIPFEDNSFDLVLLTTTICFLEDIQKSFKEIYRILKNGGTLVNAFVNKDSHLGQKYLKKDSVYYKNAKLYSLNEALNILESFKFKVLRVYETMFEDNMFKIEKGPINLGGFVVIKSIKI